MAESAVSLADIEYKFVLKLSRKIRFNFCAELMLIYEPLFEAISSNDSWNGASFHCQTTHINVHWVQTASIQWNEKEKNSSPNLIMTNLWNLHKVIYCMATWRPTKKRAIGTGRELWIVNGIVQFWRPVKVRISQFYEAEDRHLNRDEIQLLYVIKLASHK